MVLPQILEGTAEEIGAMLRSDEFKGRKLRVMVEAADVEDLSDQLPTPPNSVRDREHLVELLLEGVASPKEILPDNGWSELRKEVRDRLSPRDA